MPNEGSFPSKEADKDAHFKIVVPYLVGNAARLNVSAENSSQVNKDLDEWNDWYLQSQNLNTSTKLIVVNKNIAMVNIMHTLKSIYNDIPKSALTSDDRVILNLPERSTTRTPVPVPITFPVGQLNVNVRLEHTISFSDEDGKHGKPHGVRGCQIWCKEGEPVLSVKELRFLATDTSSPYLNKFDVSDIGKTIHYWLRWENSRGETGPWSTVITGIVAG